jgi:hypothetical protein
MYLKSVVRDIDRQISELQKARKALVGLRGAVGNGRRGGHTMSAAGRRKISLAQKARWAKVRAGKK